MDDIRCKNLQIDILNQIFGRQISDLGDKLKYNL